VRLGLKRVPEEDQQVDVTLRDLGADLLVTAQRAALEAGDGQAELVAEQPARRPGRAEVVPGQQPPVEPRPFPQVRLFVSWAIRAIRRSAGSSFVVEVMPPACGTQIRPPLNRCYRRVTI